MFYESKHTFEPLKKWRSFALYHLFTLRLSDALMTPLRQLKNQKIYSQLSLSPISRFMFLLLWNIEENLGFFSIWLAARKLEPCQLMDAVFWWRFPRQKYSKEESKIITDSVKEASDRRKWAVETFSHQISFCNQWKMKIWFVKASLSW